MMHYAYVDESGGSLSFTLGCVLVPADNWLPALDNFIGFRRYLRARYGLRMRDEVKANFILHNHGPFLALALSESARFSIYRGFMRLHAKIGIQAFAIVMRCGTLGLFTARDYAWDRLIQRLERFTTRGNHTVMLIHDEGENMLVRKALRRARRVGIAGRHYGGGFFRRPAERILEDPIPRDSRDSYFVQLADLDAFAAFRRVFPPPARPVQIVHDRTWDEIGGALYLPVNQLLGGPPAIHVGG